MRLIDNILRSANTYIVIVLVFCCPDFQKLIWIKCGYAKMDGYPDIQKSEHCIDLQS